MRVKPKKAYTLSPEIKAVTDAVINAPPGGLAAALESFQWTFEKGDFNQWVPLLNHFDAFFEKHVGPRSDLRLDWEAGTQDPTLPAAEIAAILRVTTIILDNCSNKHLYQSAEHLAALLAAPQQEIVAAALTALMALVRKSHSSNPRLATEADLSSRLVAIAQGWGGKEQGLDMVACSSSDETSIQQGIQKATQLHFSFYASATQAAREDQIGLNSAGRLVTIDLPDVCRMPQSEHEILRDLVQQFHVPKYLRFKLLSQIRVAKRFGGLPGRRELVANRLMAFVVFLQANASHEDMAAYFIAETELVSELINLAEAEALVPEPIRGLALRALAVQMLDRQRLAAVVTALNAGGQSGLLATLMRGAVSALTSGAGGTTIGFAEALFSLISALVASSSGCSALASAGLVPALLPMLDDHEPGHIHLVTSVVRILETYMEFVSTASTLFRDLGGRAQMIKRLDHETRAGSTPLQQGAPPPNPGGASVPFARRNLLKFLLRAIALASYSPGGGARPQEAEQEELFLCLRRIMAEARQFGGALFSLAASVMTDLIHHDPLVFRALDDAGLPQAFLDAVKVGVMPTGDTIAGVPTTLVAICLNANGATLVKDSGALECLIPVLTTPAYIRALTTDTVGRLGTGLDELMRHVPPLREPVVAVLLKVLQSLIRQGGYTGQLPTGGEAAQTDSAQPMETDSGVSGEPTAAVAAGPSSSASGTEADSAQGEAGQQLGEMIQRTARVLEGVLGNGETARQFASSGGAALLLLLYDLPNLAPVPGSHSPLHAVTAALRFLAQVNAKQISKLLAAHLRDRLAQMHRLAEETKDESVPLLPDAKRRQYTRELQMMEGLLGLAASLARMSVDLLAEISRGDPSLTVKVSELERIIVKQTTLAQEWKLARDAARAAEAEKNQDEAVPSTDMVEDAVAAGQAAERAVAEEDGMQEGGPDDSAAAIEPVPGAAKPKKRTEQEVAYDALIQFASTARLFYVQIAKAIHNPSRRREEASGTPCMSMQAAAAVVSITMRDSLTAYRGMWPLLEGLPAEEACREHPGATTQLANYLTHMAGGLGNTLFDSRRRTCHSLILNYFVAGGGLKVLLDHFSLTVELLSAANRLPTPPEPSEPAASPSPQKLLKTAVEGSVRMTLQLLDHLVNAEQLLGSPQAASLLLLPIPGSKAGPPQASAEELVKAVQAAVSAAVMPLWARPELAATSPEVAQRLVSILAKCTSGTAAASGQGAARAGLRAAFQPEPSTVQQIVEMGFSHTRAEEALRRVQHNSVELAMEWLISHPEEAAPSTSAAADTELAQSFSGILNRGGAWEPPQPQVPAAPEPQQLVSGAVSLLARSPAAAFSLADLLAALTRRDDRAQASAVLQQLLEVLRGGPPGEQPTCDGRADSSLQAPAHILALLTANDAELVPLLLEQGVVPIALDLIEGWLKSTATASRPVPNWVDALLLILDQAAKTTLPAAGDAEQEAESALADQEGSASQPKAAEGDESGTDAATKKLHASVNKLYRPGGLLSPEEQSRGAEICISLLKHLTSPNAELDSWGKGDTLALPSAHAQAVLQLLARLTKQHALAAKALNSRVHQQLLALPAAAMCPELTAHMCAVMRHLLEDPATLLAAMEAEIRSTLSPHRGTEGSPGQGGMPLRLFLTNMTPVMGRDPTRFSEALQATCIVVRETGSSRPIIRLKPAKTANAPGTSVKAKPEEAERPVDDSAAPPGTVGREDGSRSQPRRRGASDARTPKHKDDAKEVPKSSAKGTRKAVPASFVEVVDTLLDHLQQHRGVVLSQPATSAESSGAPPQSGEAGAQQTGAASSSAGAGAAGSSKGAAEPAESEAEKKAMSEREHQVLMQCIAMKMLTDFTLMYTSTVGVVLRRDAEPANRAGSPRAKTPRKDATKHTGALFRHILAAHLAADPEPGLVMHSLAQQASHFLLAVSIRSAEGRRRIIACIVDGLAGTPPGQSEALGSPSKPPLYKVKALVELIASLMCIQPSRGAGASFSHFQEMMRAMLDAGVLKALLQVLRGLDVNHPKAPQLINTILKPFEVLTRSFLWRGKSGDAAGAQAAADKEGAPPIVTPGGGQQPAANPGDQPRGEPQGQGQDRAAHQESAGPDAVAAAQQALQEFDRQHDESDVDPQHARDLEDMVEAIMEQAYAEDMLDDYGSDSEGSGHSDEDMEEGDEMEGGHLSGDEHEGMEDSGEDEEEDDDEHDDMDDDMSDDYSSDGSSDEDGLHDEDEPVLIEAGEDGEDDVEDFLEAEEDEEEDEEGAIILEGPDFDVLDNAFQGGLGGEPHEPAADEEGNAQFEDEEDWEDEEEEEEEEDEEEMDNAEAMEAGGMLDEMLEWDITGAQFGRTGFGGPGMQTPTQAMLEEIFGSLGRLRTGMPGDRRRYHVVTQLPTGGAPRARRASQHALLQRPAQQPTTGASGQAGSRELHPMATALMNQLGLRRHQVGQLGVFASDRHGGGYLLFPDGRSPGYVGADGRVVAQASGGGGEPPASAVFSNSIDMLVGGGAGSSRGEGRMASWSDDGLPPTSVTLPPGTAIGTLEQQLADALAEAPAAAPEPAAAPGPERATSPPAEAAPPQEPAVQPTETEPPAAPEPAAQQPPASEEEIQAEPPQVRPPSPEVPAQVEASDQEMADAAPLEPSTEMADAAPLEPAAEERVQEAGEDGVRAADIEMGPTAAEGVDQAFLDALPAALRAEMLASRAEPEAAAPQAEEPPPAAAATRGEEPEQEDELEGIDPEFIAALPPELQAEVLEQQRRERRARQAAARRAEQQQQQQAAGEAGGSGTGGADMDMATILATFPPEVREEVLLTSDDAMLASLTPALLAEAQSLRERVLRGHGRGAGAAAAVIGELGALTRSMQAVAREPRAAPAAPRAFGAVPFSAQQRRSIEPEPRDADEDGPAPIDDEDVEVLVELMKLPQPLGRQLLQRVFTNLCGHRQTRRTMLRLLVRLLQASGAVDDSSGGEAGADGLQPVSCKRFLDMLIHLARFKPRVAQELSFLPVAVPTAPDAKGKSIAGAPGEVPAIEALLGLLGGTLCERSNSHLVLALHLLELVLSASKQSSPAPATIGSSLPSVPEASPQPSQQDVRMTDGEATPTAGARPEEGSSGGAASEPGDQAVLAQQAVAGVPPAYVRRVARLLGWQRLSELACTRAALVASRLADAAPRHRDTLLTALDEELRRCGEEAKTELQRLADRSPGSRASQAGAPVLRLLAALTGLTKPVAGQTASPAAKAVLDGCAARLEGLWGILSLCIGRIEEGLGGQAPQQTQLLPPEAAQVLPFVEAFFMLCDARTAHLPAPEPAMLRAASAELAGGSGTPLSRARSLGGAASLEAHLPFLRFAERHRKLLNALLRQHPQLLEGSLSPLLRVPRLVDFDNKRAYFRAKIRSQGGERHHGSLRINVRREHVFEDSFHQLRVRTPEEMRAKLSVHFTGEEGIDAGGVSREWYQVIAREMFNPNFSLFVPVPEGGNTFQPNPNSIVQNDEARGTNHLDFFKFVGRVVGKALYDGMFVDAYFTRSLYKHMLDQPLTYMDIEAVDPEYSKNLAWMLENDITDVLDLTFTEEVDYFGRKELKELKPGGRDIKVTEANKREYVDLVTQHHMTTAIRGQLDAFLGGFWDLVPKDLIKLFNDHELELLISGLPEIDVDDLRANTEYTGYTAASPVIQWFWEIVRGLEKQDLALLVQFVTGTSKVPLEGFRALQGISGPQKFQIHKGYGGEDRLPSAHTCFNQLDLIEYSNQEALKERLLTAIREGTEGFGFG